MGNCDSAEPAKTTTEAVPEPAVAEKPAEEKAPEPAAAPVTEEKPAPAPITFVVKVEKGESGSKVGLDVMHSEGKYLKVKTVKEGLVQEWNKANADKAVMPDDMITDVNGITGKSDDMLATIKKDASLSLTVSRTPA